MGKVRETFYDKVAKRERRKGQEYQAETQERLDHLVALGLVVPVQQLAMASHAVKTSGELEPELQHVGGGYYLLPNGEKIKGKDKALEALQALANNT